jgi:lysophospholipase L1-like esterase
VSRLIYGLGAALLGALLCAVPADARAASAAATVDAVCTAPTDLTRLRGLLNRTSQRIERREPLTIVALGSSSTAGHGASGPANSYPSQLAGELKRLLPQPVVVINKGVGGETSPEMLARFDRDVLPFHPDLVIWQAGTNGVLRGLDAETSRRAVESGVRRLKAAGIDVMLMDLQFAPMVLQHPGYRATETALAGIAKQEGIPLFGRFALMQYWITTGKLDFASMLSPDGLHLNDLSYRCVGRLLGDAIVERTRDMLVAAHRAGKPVAAVGDSRIDR